MLHRINLFIFFSVIFNFCTYGQGFEVKSINTISTTDDPRDAFIVDLDGDGDQDVIAAVFQWNDIIWYKNDGNQKINPVIIDNNITLYLITYIHPIVSFQYFNLYLYILNTYKIFIFTMNFVLNLICKT